MSAPGAAHAGAPAALPDLPAPRFRPVSLMHASRLLNHGPTVLVTSAAHGRRNVMAAAWSMPVEFTPPRVAVVIDKTTFTRELVSASGAFALCIPGTALAGLVWAAGQCSGRDGDKFVRLGLQAQPGPVLGMPVVEQGCAAWLECRRIPEPHAEQAYDTCFAEVVAAAADERIFSDGRWAFRDDNVELQTVHYLGGGTFVRASGLVDAVGMAAAGGHEA